MASQDDNAEATLASQPGESKGDIDSLLKSLGLSPKSTMEQFSEAVSKSGGLQTTRPQGALGNLVSQLAAHVGDPIKQAAEAPLSQSLTAGFSGTEAAPQTAAPAKKKAAPTLEDPTKAAAAVTQQSPYEELANALANSYLQQVNQLEPLISGQGIFGAGGQTQQALQAAEQMAPGSAGFLQQAADAEGKAAVPLQQAMGQVGEAEAQGALGSGQAIANTGQANTEYLAAAPYQQILSELAQETAYKAASGQGAAAFGATAQNTPAWLQNIFKTLGLAGTTGITAPGTPSVPTPKKAATGGTSGTTSATSGTGNPSGPGG